MICHWFNRILFIKSTSGIGYEELNNLTGFILKKKKVVLNIPKYKQIPFKINK